MLTLQSIFRARRPVAELALRTPLTPCPALSGEGRQVRLKLETVQPTGAFKIRGAANALAALTPAQAERGVVCASTGNHGRALSHAAAARGIPAIVCMSSLVPENKRQAISDLGAEIRIVGNSQDDAQQEVDHLVQSLGMNEIPPFDHPDIIAGQGTIGLEIMEDWPEVDTVLVPLSGGGLIGGAALAVKSISPHIRVVGISMERGAAMQASLAAGKPVAVPEEPSLADSLGGGIGLRNRHTFSLARDLVDEIILLSEADIAAGMRHLYHHHGLVTEGAAAVGVAALVTGKVASTGPNIAAVISGRNVDPVQFGKVLTGTLPA
ncbi:hydroxyectoine utilization dehydratase EutB [Sneathiella chinensis]|uniref:Hydroxyectoine utilization dehydratase EutB n=1 Tax=Sneathiella chinensis TaxID=349750 RepID=A0ABQ5U0G6_9PROT|nr:hydroxyectoine utilization dehydratase EutB [Sneathiella chinensis]GLQ04827.1 hydroxyectoine utilization dehydratase EutB [Sneathiella chinensis]